MPALQNARYEKYANELAELKPQLEAFVAAGYSPDKAYASRIAKRPDIRGRVRELLEEAAEYADVRRVRVLVELDRVGRANLADFYEEDGKTLKNIKTLPRSITAALAGIEWDEDGVAKVKLHPKNEANFTLLRHLGGLPEPERQNVNIFNVLAIEDQRCLADFIENVAGRVEAAGLPAPGERSETGEVP